MRKQRAEKPGVRQYAPSGSASVFKKTLRWLLRHIPSLLIVTGCLIIFFAIFARFYAGYRQQELVRAYQSAFTSLQETDQPAKPDSSVPEENTAKKPEENAAIGNIDALGILTIPKIDLSVLIGQDVGNDILRFAVGHFKGTALPGETGNCCIAGHRNYTWGKFFNRLNEVAKGDKILIDRDGKTYTYTVTETLVVDPEDTWVLNQTQNAEITLVTCTPIRVATHRLIVKGILETK